MLQAKASNNYDNDENTDQPVNIPNVAILGTSPLAEKLFRNLKDDHSIVGFIQVGPSNTLPIHGEKPVVLGSANQLRDIVQKYDIERVWLAVDPNDASRFSEAIQCCKREKLAFDLPTATGYIPNGKHRDDAIYNNTALYERFLNDLIGDEVIKQPLLHRVIDLLVSIALFILFLPSWVVVALAIKLESRGGVLYSQERVGRGGKTFRIYKFRSMFVDAEKRNGPQLATLNDPRITRVGRMIRKTRIDELPQLFNVIKGNMSLIGPRPERPYFVERYRQQIPNYVERLRIKPGLTGYAQVETGYDETLEDVRIKLKHDLYYIDNFGKWSLYNQIFIKTIWVVLTAKGQ